jgi:hypothetical protein
MKDIIEEVTLQLESWSYLRDNPVISSHPTLPSFYDGGITALKDLLEILQDENGAKNEST